MTRRLYYMVFRARSGSTCSWFSRRQRKRSTSNKIRVQRLINNITQNRAPPDHTDCVWLFPVSLALSFRPSLSLSSLELELHYFYFYGADSHNSAAGSLKKKMAVPPLDSRNLHRISTELRFLEETLGLQPADQPEHLRAWVIWLRDLNKQWASPPITPPLSPF